MHFTKVALSSAWTLGTAKLFVCLVVTSKTTKKYEKNPSKQ